MLGSLHRHAGEMRFAGGPMMARLLCFFGSYLHTSTEKNIKFKKEKKDY